MPPPTLRSEREEPGGSLLSIARSGALGDSINEIAEEVERALGGNMDEIRERIQSTMARPPPTLAISSAAVAPLNATDRGRRELGIGADLDRTLEGYERRVRRAEPIAIVSNGRRIRIDNTTMTASTIMPQNDTTYDLILQESRARSVHYGRGFRNRWPPVRTRYRSDREIPLSRTDACRCELFRIANACHMLQNVDTIELMHARHRDERRRARRQALGDAGLFSTISDRALVELRQARALAGVDVSEYDLEITRRILADPSGWGAVGDVIRQRGWVDEVLEHGENYVLH